MFTARVQEEKDVAPTLKKLPVVSTILSVVVMLFVTKWALPATFVISGSNTPTLVSTGVTLLEQWLVCGGTTDGIHTSHDFAPVRKRQSPETGSATNIIFGLALATTALLDQSGDRSAFMCHLLRWNAGSDCSLGMLSTLIIGLVGLRASG